MGTAIFIAFVLFVMGGLTAYVGDRLGSYIGKKRRSTFGLRPRHTALLWTVLSGGGIAVVTLLLLLGLDSKFKTALLRGPQLLATESLLESQNAALTRHNLATERQAQADGLRAVQAQRNADRAQAEADRARDSLASVAGDLGRARVTLTRSQVALAQRQIALSEAQRQLAAAKTGLNSTRQDLADAVARVQVARRGVLFAQKQVRLARLQAAQADQEALQANTSVLALGVQQDRLHSENARLLRLNRAQQSLLQASLGHALIFRRDEELGRTVVSANQPPDSVRRELAVFLDQIELTARQRGAGGLDNSPAVLIPALGEDPAGGAAAREVALDALTGNIAEKGGFFPSIVVVARARDNTFGGETVKLDLRPYANVMVFPKGMVIAQTAVDGGQSEIDILTKLQAFLTRNVRAEALDKGIIPLRDPETGEPLVGQPIEKPKWLDLVKQIQQAGPNAHVTASAAEDTYSGDLLRLDLNVTGGETHATARTE